MEDLSDKHECESALSYIKPYFPSLWKFENQVSWNSRPKGCYVDNAKMYFNTHKTGNTYGTYQCICKTGKYDTTTAENSI